MLFEGTPKPGAFEINFATETDKELLVDTTGSEVECRNFLISSPREIQFEPGKRYKIGFDYEVHKLKSDATRLYYFLEVTNDDSSQRAKRVWAPKEGESDRQEFISTLPDSDGYRLCIGIANGGAITIKNLKIEEIPPPKLDKGFLYQGAMENDERLRFNYEGKIVNGGFLMNTPSKQWKPYFSTSPQELSLLPGHTYRISYSYSAENAEADAFMRHTCFTTDGKTLYTQRWAINPGQSDFKEIQLEITEPGSSFTIGSYGKSTVRIEDFTIEDLGGQ
ncbi:MAG: hypothetical protein WCG66_12370 [bacterium]